MFCSLTCLTWWILLACFFYIIRKCYDQLTYWKRRGVPCGFEVPFVNGLATFIFKPKSLPDLSISMYNRFPTARYYGTKNVVKPLIIVRDIELIREICIKSFDSFTDHQNIIDPSSDPIFGRNILSLKGQRWRDMRSTLSPSFTANKMKFMFPLLAQCASNFVSYYQKHPEATELIDMKDAFTRYTTDVIATAAFGISVNSLEDPNNEFFFHGKQITGFNNIFGIFKILLAMIAPRLMRLLGITFLPGKTNKFFRNLITETVKMRDEKGIVRPDMIHLMMEARDKENMTIDDIVAQAIIFFLGGFDTSSTLMCFIAHELALNQDIQERLREEIDDCLPFDEEVTYEKLSEMKYLDMVINETLRKYPPGPITDRVCTKSFKLPPGMPGYSDYIMDVGVMINFPIFAIHHDPQYFSDPERFDPERFNDENKDHIDPCAYMPFGCGPRKCIANRFALMETKILFVNLLKNFVIKRSDKTVHPIVFNTNLTMLPKDGFWNILENRKKTN